MNTARVHNVDTGVNNVKTGERKVVAGERNVKTGLNIQAARRHGMARGLNSVARARDPLDAPCKCGFSRTRTLNRGSTPVVPAVCG